MASRSRCVRSPITWTVTCAGRVLGATLAPAVSHMYARLQIMLTVIFANRVLVATLATARKPDRVLSPTTWMVMFARHVLTTVLATATQLRVVWHRITSTGTCANLVLWDALAMA